MVVLWFFKCCSGLPVVCKVNGVVTMKSIDMYIVHDSSLVLCFSNILGIFYEKSEVMKLSVYAPMSA